jgi:hypothetical protein
MYVATIFPFYAGPAGMHLPLQAISGRERRFRNSSSDGHRAQDHGENESCCDHQHGAISCLCLKRDCTMRSRPRLVCGRLHILIDYLQGAQPVRCFNSPGSGGAFGVGSDFPHDAAAE